MTVAVNGKKVDEAQAVAGWFLALVPAPPPPDGDDLGDLAALAGVASGRQP